MSGVASLDPVSTTMHSPARSLTESRHRARLRSSFLTIRQRLRAAGIARTLPAAARKEIKQTGSRHCGLGLNGRLVAGLLARQIHAGRGHVGVSHGAERGLVLKLELLSYGRGIGDLILHSSIKLELLRQIVRRRLKRAHGRRDGRLIVARESGRQALYREENIAGIRLTGAVTRIENLRRRLRDGKRYAGRILNQTVRRIRDQLGDARRAGRIQLVGWRTGLVAAEDILAFESSRADRDKLGKNLFDLLGKPSLLGSGVGRVG